LVTGLGFFVLLSCTALFAQYAGYYVLDGYGGVHAGGGAAAITPATAYFGWDIAKDIAFIPVAYSDSVHGDGYLVLDGYGGIHRGGKLASISVASTPYFGWNIARALDFRRIDPQAYGTALTTYADYTDNVIHTLSGPINMGLPDAGYVLVTGSVWVINTSTTAGQNLDALVGIGANSETTMDTASMKGVTVQAEPLTSAYNSATVSVSRLFYFDTSGTQRFYLLVRRDSGTGTVRAAYPCFNAVYFNKRYDGYSMSSGDQDSGLLPGVSQAEPPNKIK
jgi:hypothetical protein